MTYPATMIIHMKALLSYLIQSGHEETYYKVNKDGALVLDRDALLQSGKMKRQLDAARELKKQAARTARHSAVKMGGSALRDK